RSAGAGFYSGTEKICFPAHGGSFLKCEAANCIAKARNVYATGLVVGRSHPLRNIQRTFWSPKWSPTGDHGPIPDGTQRYVRPIFAIQINTCQDRTKRVGTAVNKFRVRCFQPLSHLSMCAKGANTSARRLCIQRARPKQGRRVVPPEEGCPSRDMGPREHLNDLTQLVGQLAGQAFAERQGQGVVVPEGLPLRHIEACPDFFADTRFS